ncbi:DNA pilot protein VP2 [Microviridae Bog1249_12]|uniref:DNA pilot protein VP2 n=1 Tax=Microviridae Bog1249_12 TaxID=1655647 RepID=UPI00063D5861|nr:DNA pilot protein VP2 [Microviridae Bog1249_12]AKI26874.1 DNA pilot protein VP2 [Microviridae Bog1249_12]AKI26917.1 DNA pilot protein VP2 [Microviridae Fen51_42]
MAFLGNLLNGLSGGLTGIVGNVAQTFLQNNLNQNAINQQNEYNSPVQQMARLKAAGLNPNLIYGSGGNVGNQPTPADVTAPTINPQESISAALGISAAKKQNALLDQQLLNLKSQKRQIDANEGWVQQRTLNDTLQYGLMHLRGLSEEAKQPFFDQNAKYSSEAMKLNLGKLASEIGLKGAQRQSVLKDLILKTDVHRSKELENRNLSDLGVQRNDPGWLRIMLRMAQKAGLTEFLK